MPKFAWKNCDLHPWEWLAHTGEHMPILEVAKDLDNTYSFGTTVHTAHMQFGFITKQEAQNAAEAWLLAEARKLVEVLS